MLLSSLFHRRDRADRHLKPSRHHRRASLCRSLERLERRNLLSGVGPGSPIELLDMNAAGSDSSDTGAFVPSISDDGRYVAYGSGSTNRIPGLTVTGAVNVYLRDRQTNTTTLLSHNLSNTNGGNGDSDFPIISGNGKEVVYLSYATDIVSNGSGAPNEVQQVMVADVATGVTTLVSVNMSGGPGNDNSSSPSISADGRYVVFQSDASDLVPNDNNGNTDVFVRDLVANTTTLVSVDRLGDWSPR